VHSIRHLASPPFGFRDHVIAAPLKLHQRHLDPFRRDVSAIT
jgi:hypothetical protein